MVDNIFIGRKVQRDKRIKDVEPGKFRLGVSFEDVDIDRIVYVEPENRRMELVPEDRLEGVGVVYTPVWVGDFGRYYRRRVTSLGSDYATRLFHNIEYLNPGIDRKGVQRLGDYVYERFIDKMKIRKKDVLKRLFEIGTSLLFEEDWLTIGKLVFYKKDSHLTRDEKIRITLGVKRMYSSKVLGEVIHFATETLMLKSTYDYGKIKVTTKKIGVEVRKKEGISGSTLYRHMLPKTKDVLEEFNSGIVFGSEENYRKYLEFLKLPKGLSAEKIAKKINASMSTVVKFREYRNLHANNQ